MNRKGEFSVVMQKLALARQQNLCASCGTHIERLGEAGCASHRFGEGAQAHHVKHIKFRGTSDVGNCVILCDSCHYSAHEGGNYRFGTVVGEPEDFPFYTGSTVFSREDGAPAAVWTALKSSVTFRENLATVGAPSGE
jgi:hypothetical protein